MGSRPMNEMMTFGDWLRQRRKALDLTQEQLADRVSCSTETIRKIEIDAVRSLLWRVDVRLLTLTGAGGSGKTRLAIQVADDLRQDLQDGVFFVSLGAVTDHSLVASTIARTLGIRETPGQSLTNS